MRKKGALLGSVLAVTVSSAPALATDFNTPTGLQGTTPSPLQNAVLGAKEFGAECESIDNSTATTWNVGEFCLVSDHSTSTKDLADLAPANEAAVAGSQIPLRDGSSHSESRRSPRASAQMGAECVSVSGSSAATEDGGGFCLASDLRTSKTGFVNLGVANSLPVAGLQFLQVSLRDGSQLVGSGPFPSAGAPMGPVCVSVGGSSAATEDEGEGAFCLASDLSTSKDLSTPKTGYANFAVANSLSIAGLQFVQITFADRGSPGGSRHSPGAGAQCVSVGGSTAATGDAGRFCLASDLSTSTMGFANLSVANDLPVAAMHHLQVTFRDRGPLDGSGDSPGAGEPMGAECVSVDGSTATTGDAGEFCLASDLRTLTAGAANFAVANDLLVAGMQYLQITFRDGSALAGHSPDAGAKCGSVGGSTAATENTGGFCLVSDRNTSKTGFANFAVANDLPVATLQFVRVPFRDGGSLDGSPLISSAEPPMGVVIFDPDWLPIPRLPALAGIADHPQRYFPSSEQASRIVMHLSPDGRRHPRPVFWLGRRRPPEFTCNGLPATIVGNNNNNTIFGTQGNDVIHGRGGNDVIHGLQGNDVICGGAGNDQLFGDQGKDRLFGGAGNDDLKGGMANDRLFGQKGNDAMHGQKGNDDNCNGDIGADTATSCEQSRNVP